MSAQYQTKIITLKVQAVISFGVYSTINEEQNIETKINHMETKK